MITSENQTETVEEISFKTHQAITLVTAFLIIPFDSNEKVFGNFIKHFILILTEDLKIEDSYSFHTRKEQKQVHPSLILDIEFYMSELLLKTDFNSSKQILDLILNPSYAMFSNNKGYKKDLFDFSSNIIQYLILKLDEMMANSKDELTKEPVE